METEELIKRLRPLVGKQADDMWHSYLASDPEERKLIRHSLENLHSQLVDDYNNEKIILMPPFKFEQLHGEYPAGMVYYADKPLYPFAFQEKELVQHLGVFGRTGAGKTFFVKSLLKRHILNKKPFILFDWKNTYTDLNAVVVQPGRSDFHFNPLEIVGIDSYQQKTYIRQVIELFIDSYLDLKLLTVQGVESLLIRAVNELFHKQASVTFHDIYSWLEHFEGRAREMEWRITALNLLNKMLSGPLGYAMQAANFGIEQLANCRIVFELSSIGSDKDKSFFIRTLLLRLYAHFKKYGSFNGLRNLIIIEEAHNILLRKLTGSESVIEVVLRQIREYGVGVIIVDQHPSLISYPALGTYSTVAFNLKLRQDREAMSSALNLGRPEYLGKLPARFAIVKLADRFMTPFLLKTFDLHAAPVVSQIHKVAEKQTRPGLPLSPHLKKIVEQLEQLQPAMDIPPGLKLGSEECSKLYGMMRMGERVPVKGLDEVSQPVSQEVSRVAIAPPTGFSAQNQLSGVSRAVFSDSRNPRNLDYREDDSRDTDLQGKNAFPDGKGVSQKGFSAGFSGSSEVSRASQGVPLPVIHVRQYMSKRRSTPITDEELLMCHLYAFPLKSTGGRYAEFGWSWDHGNSIRRSLQNNNLVRQENVPTQKARIKLIVPTKEGFEWLQKKGFKIGKQKKKAGIEHRYWQRRLKEQFEKLGYSVGVETPLQGHSAVDLLVSKGDKRAAVEIETGANSYQHILENIRKCRGKFNGIVSLILNRVKAMEMRKKTREGIVVLEESECIREVRELLGDAG